MTRFAAAAFFAASILSGADLAFERLSLHQFEDGPTVVPGYQHLPGEAVWLGVRLKGFATEKVEADSNDRRAKLTWKAQAFDPAGVPLIEPITGKIEEVLLTQDRDWSPKVMEDFAIPAFVPTGTYKVKVSVHDEIAKADAESEVTFRVRGDPPVAAETLGIRDFRFMAKETDRLGLQPAIYSPGDTLFARFDIVGYKLAEKNRFEVEYGLAIFAGEKPMFTQADAARDTGTGFYPQKWVPGGFSLNLTRDLKPGIYTVKVTVRDRIGDTSLEIPQTFEVR